MSPITFGNVVMMCVGVAMVLGGPYIIYRTITGVLALRKEQPEASTQPFSNGLNVLIGAVLFLAGILFVLNNARGTVLAAPLF